MPTRPALLIDDHRPFTRGTGERKHQPAGPPGGASRLNETWGGRGEACTGRRWCGGHPSSPLAADRQPNPGPNPGNQTWVRRSMILDLGGAVDSVPSTPTCTGSRHSITTPSTVYFVSRACARVCGDVLSPPFRPKSLPRQSPWSAPSRPCRRVWACLARVRGADGRNKESIAERGGARRWGTAAIANRTNIVRPRWPGPSLQPHSLQ